MADIKPIIKEDFVVLDEDTGISEVISKLQNFEKRTGLVFRNNKYIGIVEKKCLLKSRMDINHMKVKYILQKSPILNENTDLLEAAYLMHHSDVDYLPVEKNKKIIGVVNGLDLAQSIMELPEARNIKVKEIKLLKPAKVNVEDPLGKAIMIMHDEGIDHVPIYQEGKIFGVLSFRDFLRKFLNWNPRRDASIRFNETIGSSRYDDNFSNMASLPVDSFSTNDQLIMVDVSNTLKAACSLMATNRVHDVLVSDKEDFKGMLTVKNILKKMGTLNVPVKFNIQFVGLKEAKLKPLEKRELLNIASTEAQRLQRKADLERDIIVHIKEYGKKESGREKYSITLRTEIGEQVVTSSADSWDLDIALKTAFERLTEEVTRKLSRQLTKDKQKG